MGSRGPIASVTALPGVSPKRQVPKRVTFEPASPEPPDDLNAEALEEWRRVVPILDGRGLLSLIDRAVLTTYCDAWALHERARVEMASAPLTVLSGSDKRPAKNPLWQIYRESGVLVAMLAKELFASPNARLRSELPEVDDGEAEGEGILD